MILRILGALGVGIEQKIAGCMIGLVLTVVSGFWLSNSGRPYSTGALTAHKLIALATVVVVGLLIFGLQKHIELRAGAVLLIAGAVFSVLALFVSGALLSIGNVPHLAARAVHIAATVTATITAALSIYTMLKNY